MLNVSFMMNVDVWADDVKVNCKDNQEAIIKWYMEMNDDKQNLKVEYVISNIFKITYTAEDEEEYCMMETVADPDDDGNYPIKIKGKFYLVCGKIIDNTISQS